MHLVVLAKIAESSERIGSSKSKGFCSAFHVPCKMTHVDLTNIYESCPHLQSIGKNHFMRDYVLVHVHLFVKRLNILTQGCDDIYGICFLLVLKQNNMLISCNQELYLPLKRPDILKPCYYLDVVLIHNILARSVCRSVM